MNFSFTSAPGIMKKWVRLLFFFVTIKGCFLEKAKKIVGVPIFFQAIVQTNKKKGRP